MESYSPDPISSEQPESSRSSLLHKKWLLVLIGVGIVSVIMYVALSPAPTQQMVEPAQPTGVSAPSPTTPFRPQPTSSAREIQHAVEEAKQSAQVYDTQQAERRTDYPWLRKFPLAGKGYFVYFDVQKEAYVARLYPTVNDSIPVLKETVRRALVAREIPPDAFPFDWTILPQ